MRPETGFSLIEALVAMWIALVPLGVVLALMGPARDAFAAQPEASDQQQRLRVSADTLAKDLVMAGSGTYVGSMAGPLTDFFASVLPYRASGSHADPPGTMKADTISLTYVPSTVAQTTLSTPGPNASTSDVGVNIPPGCPTSVQACGFQTGMTALVFDASGLHDTFTVTSVAGNTLSLQSRSPALMYVNYPAVTTTIVQVVNVVYSLKFDPSGGAFQLVRSDGGVGPDAPVVDHIVGLTFDYYGDPQPPRRTATLLASTIGPWTTYGPPPPPLGTRGPTGGYPPGESCLFFVDPLSGEQSPRLPLLDANGSGALVRLTATELTDGPWCPDAAAPNRWDADLLRVRSVVVRLRLQSANAALRGPAGPLFTNGGTANGVSRWLPDIEATFQVTPRNLNFGR